MGEDGFEPSKSVTTDLQSAPFGRSGILPYMPIRDGIWSWWTDSNPRPADYKSAALPAELHQLNWNIADYNTDPAGCQQFFVRSTLFTGKYLVEVTGLEPAASWSQTKHSTKLSYTSVPDTTLLKQCSYYYSHSPEKCQVVFRKRREQNRRQVGYSALFRLDRPAQM